MQHSIWKWWMLITGIVNLDRLIDRSDCLVGWLDGWSAARPAGRPLTGQVRNSCSKIEHLKAWWNSIEQHSATTRARYRESERQRERDRVKKKHAHTNQTQRSSVLETKSFTICYQMKAKNISDFGKWEWARCGARYRYCLFKWYRYDYNYDYSWTHSTDWNEFRNEHCACKWERAGERRRERESESELTAVSEQAKKP